MLSPQTHFYVANTCSDDPGGSRDAAMPPLLAALAKAPTQDARRKIAAAIQKLAYDLAPAVSWGQFTIPAAYRSSLAGLVLELLMFWDVSKA